MLRIPRRIFRRALSILRVGWLTLRVAGPRVFFMKLGHQLYGRTYFVGRFGDLSEVRPVPEGICYIRFATPDEVEEFFQKMNEEKSPESRYQLLVRRWFYDSGFRRVIIAWTADTNEMCFIKWMVTAQDIRDAGFEGRLPELQEDDVMNENTYTLERFRGRGIPTAANRQLRIIYQKLGFKRSGSQISEDNIQAIKRSERRGGLIAWRALEQHFLFRVKRTTVERFDPPVPIRAPGENYETDAAE